MSKRVKMPKDPDDQELAISRLPKWAQNLIQKLRADVEYYKEKLRQIEEEDSCVTYAIAFSRDVCHLPDSTTVTYEIEERGNISVSLSRNRRFVEVCGMTTDGQEHSFAIISELSNSFRAAFVEREDK